MKCIKKPGLAGQLWKVSTAYSQNEVVKTPFLKTPFLRLFDTQIAADTGVVAS